MKLTATPLHPGVSEGELLLLDQPLSFWGGFEPTEGRIIDVHHPQVGILVGNRILAMPETRGSAGTPAGLAEAIRRGVGPLAMILIKGDFNIIAGVMVAQRLYDINVPVLQLAAEDYSHLENGTHVRLMEDGSIKLNQAHERPPDTT